LEAFSGWLAGNWHGDVAADVSILQMSLDDLTVTDLREVHRTLKYVKAAAGATLRINHIDPANMIIVAFGDAAWANAPGCKSQAALLVFVSDRSCFVGKAPCSIMEWKSHRLRRVCRSTLAAEAAALDASVDHGNFLGAMLSEMVCA
jgi:hypothetical protein